ncbi:hypothetical protein [Calidifontibacillus erzurumensis]|uniref:Uncharacterized protein n=1 Tax=Calidifontibacillus erzurumensis TaxID=2741433 RepID=A0A8J8GDZ9_9BACI|nr:hypothetical protein [Calidifontibacillus erzurumensis]NSL50146.1 hypothetical protein [Calidifontibacillus erzurumensis]
MATEKLLPIFFIKVSCIYYEADVHFLLEKNFVMFVNERITLEDTASFEAKGKKSR